MKKIKRHHCILIVILYFITLDRTQAANPSSTTVSVIIPALVQISGLSDISLTPTSFASPATGATTACIYTNVLTPLGSYYVTASSLNASSTTFRATNGTSFITYNAYWNATSSPSQTISLSSGVKTAQQSGGSSSSLTCSGTPNANFNISLGSAQVEGFAAATYTDTVTLLISPS